MLLYNLTLQKATGITHAICGNFRGLNGQEIAVSRGKALELLMYDPITETIQTLCSADLFAIVRSIAKFRPSKENKDCLIIGCDSGKFIILEYNMKRNVFDKAYEDTFGKSGCRRNVPGQYLAVDPIHRAAMIAAVETQKLVYVLNREGPVLCVHAPLPDSDSVLYDVVALDVGKENPVFACLEMKYENESGECAGHPVQQTLSYYKLDLYSNKGEITKSSESLSEVGNLLISVPRGTEGPGGVLICSENYITYKNLGEQPEIRCPIPKRKNDLDDPERGIIFCCSVTHTNTYRPGHLILAQTEQGDMYEITLKMDKNLVTEIKLKYFDTVAVATAMCVVNSDFLFVASEFGNHYLFKFVNSVDGDSEPEFSSAVPLGEDMTFSFTPRPLKNLLLMKEVPNFSPIIHSQVGDLYNMNMPQIYLACGRGPRSTLHILKHAVEVTALYSLKFPEVPSGCWALKYFADGSLEPCVVLSFESSTVVLSIGDTISEIEDLQIVRMKSTLCCCQFGSNIFVQVHPDGIQLINFGDTTKPSGWPYGDKMKITGCAMNEQQLVVVVSASGLVYFEIYLSDQLNEVIQQKEMLAEVTCVALSAVCPLNQKALLLAVGLAGNTIQILSLNSSNYLGDLTAEPLPDAAESICFAKMNHDMNNEDQEVSHDILYIGLKNGILLRKYVNKNTGIMSNSSARRLGYEPIKLFKVELYGNDAVIATCESTWLCYYFQNDIHLVPLRHETLSYASSFPSKKFKDSILAISQGKLSILQFHNLNLGLSCTTTLLKYTPRKFVFHPESKHLFVIETDHAVYTEKSKELRKKELALEKGRCVDKSKKTQIHVREMTEYELGAPRCGLGKWASIISIIDPIGLKAIFQVDLEQNEAAISLCLLNSQTTGSQFLLVGVVKDLQLCPRKCSGGAIHAYKVSSDGSSLDLFHKTEVSEAPGAMCIFQGKVLVSVGKVLRLYAMGEKKLLCRLQYKLSNYIVAIHADGDHIIVSDVQDGFYFLLYKPKKNQVVLFSHDTDTKHVTASTLIDRNTVAGADKFGNVYVVKLPSSVVDEVDEEGPCTMISNIERDESELNTFQKAELICSFHVGELVHSLQKVSLLPGSSESLLYTTLSGTIGVLALFTSDEDCKFFKCLELYLGSEYPFPCGRDHLSFRSSYFPVKNVIDGDLCEKFDSLDILKQKSIAESLSSSPREVSAKLQEIRAKYAF